MNPTALIINQQGPNKAAAPLQQSQRSSGALKMPNLGEQVGIP
jgi:hypothetical protein